ncbi:uncharacterized protein LOC109540064 [Dendroctonus ponderosae]|uniref:PPM-type phosphatase domain-containing protein n=1 Tax=Dendroctonus ponderosae TaxID=77166 RepID=U4UB95_DENPD|nr:uncharacterized protein LOC109540064 [Dendroctonus ponderosae]ERL87851.1 hypothetical protein D910_05239 [Dendroctonus ponderosae]KAH1018125.1 hypothetical protein HUJ05_005941 [Dendroctonus ponderosae]
MPASIGVNLRVTGNCRQGGRKYMEDCFSVAYQQTEDEKDLEYAFFGIFDGHGGVEAAGYAKEHLMETIIKHKNFWSDDDEEVLRAIKDGFIATHYAMWREQPKWPKTGSGLPSTAGTTASVAFIRRGKIYTGHVGDSGVVLGYQVPGSSEWRAKPLTKDHKPESPDEMKRIQSCGGKVVAKSGVPRVVWNRPKIGHLGPVRRSTPIDEIPFLAVARSLGDLWSYNSQLNEFVVSPEPDCSVLPIDTSIHRCLIFGTDGLFNMLSASAAVHIVQQAERHNECEALNNISSKVWLNPSKLLVERALERWHTTHMKADNTSAVTLMLDPPGPPRAQVLQTLKRNLPENGLKIMTRYEFEPAPQENAQTAKETSTDISASEPAAAKLDATAPLLTNPLPELESTEAKSQESDAISSHSAPVDQCSSLPLKERNSGPKLLRESTSFDPRDPCSPADVDKENNTQQSQDESIQINEISSSNIEESSAEQDEPASTAEPPNVGSRRAKRPALAQEKPVKSAKRKLMHDSFHKQRKSLRLTLTQKFLDEAKKPAPCTLAEEKLKKLAEEAEKSKTSPQAVEARTRAGREKDLSLTQKVLNRKKALMKKKSLAKAELKKSKLKLIFDMVVAKSGKRKLAQKPKETSVEESRAAQKASRSRKGKPDDSQIAQQSSEGGAAKRSVKKPVKSKTVLTGKLSNLKRISLRTAAQKTPSSDKPPVCEPSATSPVKEPLEKRMKSLRVLCSRESLNWPLQATLRTSKRIHVNKSEAKENIRAKGAVAKQGQLEKSKSSKLRKSR